MGRIRAIGFDFDETLVVSEDDKADIVEEIFSRKYGVKEGVRDAYKALLGKANREEKLRLLVKNLLKREPTEKEIEELSYSFGKGYEYKLSSCPLMQCTNMLKELKGQVEFTFLLSLEDRREVVSVAEHCGVARFFDEILGGPRSKVENFLHVIEKHGVKPEETAYIGDSRGDVITSKKMNFKAIGIQKEEPYRKILEQLGADFTFSSLCEVPFERIIGNDES